MSAFFVGQRVRVSRMPGAGYKPRGGVVGGKVGDEGHVAGTQSRPNLGFHPNGPCDISVKLDCNSVPGMAPSYCFEPILPDGHRPAEMSVEELLPFLGRVTP